MNLPRYKFAKETEPELLQFLKVAKEQKSSNKNCDLKSHEVWRKLLPLDFLLMKKLDEYPVENAIATIDLCSDEELQAPVESVNENEDIPEENGDSTHSTISDIAFTIKENLETQNDLSVTAREHLLKCDNANLEILFELLEQSLSSEEVYYLGTALQDIISDVLIKTFCSYLLVPKIRKEFCDKILKLLDQFSTKYASVLETECLTVLQNLTEEEIKMFLQYVKKLNPDFQSILARNFILAISQLDENYLMIIGVLLNDQVEYEALNKLVEMLSNIAEDHGTDKNFGKLLMTTIEALGPNLVHLEQPLKHIIAGHKSVWKSKLEKTFSTCYQDSLMFTQSFRDCQ